MDYRERTDGKVEAIFRIAQQYLNGQMSPEQTKETIGFEMFHIRQSQIEAVKNQLGKRLKELDSENGKKLFELFKPYLTPPFHKLKAGHPIKNYFMENEGARNFLLQLERMEEEQAAKEDWEELYNALMEFDIHIERQIRNFYPLMDSKGMGLQIERAKALGKAVREDIKKNQARLENGEFIDFLYQQRSLGRNLMDYLNMEERAIYGKALNSLTFEEFAKLREEDDAIGYAYIKIPENFTLEKIQPSVMERENIKPYGVNSEDMKLNNLISHERILAALLSAVELDICLYDSLGTPVFRMGETPKSHERILDEDIRLSLESGSENNIKRIIREGNQAFLVTYSVLRDERGALQFLKTRENIDKIRELSEGNGRHSGNQNYINKKNMNPLPSKRKLDPHQNILELFKIYPGFQEDFYKLNEELEGLRGPFGMSILAESSIEMLAKSLQTDTDELLEQINTLLKKY